MENDYLKTEIAPCRLGAIGRKARSNLTGLISHTISNHARRTLWRRGCSTSLLRLIRLQRGR